MATRQKRAPEPDIETNDPWRQVSEPLEMANGIMAIHWRNGETGQTRIVPAGIHPEDQALESYAIKTMEEDEPIEETATDRVAAMMSGAGPDERAEVKVYRINSGQLEYCAGYKPDEFESGNFDLLRDRFGAGVYELRLYATNPTSKKFAVRQKLRVTIVEEKSQTTTGGLGSGMSQVLQTIAQGQQQMLEALVSIKSAPAKDPMEEMTKMMSMMTMMREAMGLNQPQGREKSSIGEIVSAIRELRGAADEIAPQQDKEPDGLMAVLPKMLELVSKGQQSQQEAAQAAHFPPVQLPASFQAPAQPEPQPQPQEQPATQEESDMKMFTMIKLKSYLKTLIDLAIKKTSVEQGAEFVYEKIPDDLIEIMALDNWFDLLIFVAPDVKEHREWLQLVRDRALAMFEEAEAEQPKK
jgi:hypothetical protein